MKFSKGLLIDNEEVRPLDLDHPKDSDEILKQDAGKISIHADTAKAEKSTVPVARQDPPVAVTTPVEVEKDRLFQTVQETSGSGRRYVIGLGIVAVLVLIGGAAVSYFTLPDVGDVIRAPTGVEAAVREHFLTKQKRDSTDMVFYQCDGFFWARVGVETRNDIPNPVFKIATYTARATPRGEAWEITAAPLTSPEMDVPCK